MPHLEVYSMRQTILCFIYLAVEGCEHGFQSEQRYSSLPFSLKLGWLIRPENAAVTLQCLSIYIYIYISLASCDG